MCHVFFFQELAVIKCYGVNIACATFSFLPEHAGDAMGSLYVPHFCVPHHGMYHIFSGARGGCHWDIIVWSIFFREHAVVATASSLYVAYIFREHAVNATGSSLYAPRFLFFSGARNGCFGVIVVCSWFSFFEVTRWMLCGHHYMCRTFFFAVMLPFFRVHAVNAMG